MKLFEKQYNLEASIIRADKQILRKFQPYFTIYHKIPDAATGTIQMDDLADRAPSLAAFYISPNSDKITKIVQLNSELNPDCDGLLLKYGCYDIVSYFFYYSFQKSFKNVDNE